MVLWLAFVRTDLNHVAHATKHERHSGDNERIVIRSFVIMCISRLRHDGLEVTIHYLFIVLQCVMSQWRCVQTATRHQARGPAHIVHSNGPALAGPNNK